MKNATILSCITIAGASLLWGVNQGNAQYVPPPQLVPGVDYNLPNYANSPILTKFVDTLPGLGPTGANNLGNYIPVAVPMTGIDLPVGVPNDADYYEIALVDYTQQLHSELQPTKLRGYVQIEPPGAVTIPQGSLHVLLTGITYNGQQVYGFDKPRYLGPTIVATKGKATRIKFYNLLPTTAAGGDLFIPTDITVMGAGMGPDGVSMYPQNRATLHLHGGDNPWISDGTAHQWITPAGEAGTLIKGVSQQNVPGMPAPGPGSATFYWPNGQSGRLMFYHDHAFGMTRLDVYAGEAAGFLLRDTLEQGLNSLVAAEIPLIIQDKTFVNDGTFVPNATFTGIAPAPTGAVDPLWTNTIINPDAAKWGQANGSLWFPHVYVPNQNPNDVSGANPVGRWDYGAWFWPIFPSGVPPMTSVVPEAFMDTPVINGAAYPYLDVNPTAYRFRILNACNDRYVNLQLYVASPVISGITVANAGTGYTAPVVTISDATPGARGATASATVGTGAITAITLVNGGSGYTAPVVTITDPTGTGATASATVDPSGVITGIAITAAGDGYTAPVVTITDTMGSGANATATSDFGTITGITLLTVGSGYAAPTVTITDPTGTGAAATVSVSSSLTEVGMVPASKTAGIAFPSWWQANDTPGMTPNILDGRQGGVPDPTTMGPSFIHIGSEGGLSPQAVVLQNTPIGYEQNKRSVTVLNTFEHTLFLGPAERADVVVDFSAFAGKTLIVYNDAPAPLPAGDPRYDYYTGDPDNTGSGGAPSTMAGFGPNMRTIMQIKVAAGTPAPLNMAGLSSAVSSAFASTQPAPIVPLGSMPGVNVARISETSMTWTNNGVPSTYKLQPKTIQELFDPLGRMNATLGVELPFTSATIQTTIPYGFADPATEVLNDGETQLWKITHNGVDTHAIHFHLFNVQLVNRVGWDGAIKLPWPEELGWKDTVKMNPLEDIVVALKAKTPAVPFQQPDNVRLLDPSSPTNATTPFLGVGPDGNPVTVNNIFANFGQEYTWHCHLLGHEENDMMRPIMVAVPPAAPSGLTATVGKAGISLNWVNNATSISGNNVQRAADAAFLTNLVNWPVPVNATSFVDTSYKASGVPYYYRVVATSIVGSMIPPFPSITNSVASNIVGPPKGSGTVTLTQAAPKGSPVVVTWTYAPAGDTTGFTIQRALNSTFTSGLTLFKVGNVSTYSDGTTKAGTLYYYRVVPVNALGNGSPSPASTPPSITPHA